MKNKDLIRVLQALDPEQEVTFSLGRGITNEHRTMCAKAELMRGECLKYLNVSGIEIIMDESDHSVAIADVILFCDNYPDKLLEETAKEYDEKFGKNHVWHKIKSEHGSLPMKFEEQPPQDGSLFVMRMYARDNSGSRAFAILFWKQDEFITTNRNGASIPLSDFIEEWRLDAWMSLE